MSQFATNASRMQIDGVINTTKADCVQLHCCCPKARNKSSLPDAKRPNWEAGKSLWPWQTMTGLNESFWRSASIVSLGRNLHSATDLSLERSAHQDKVEAPIGGPYHSCKLQRGSSNRATAKRVAPISPIGAIPAAFGPWNLSHPFGFLQGDKLWWRRLPRRKMEMEWRWMKFIMRT